MVQFIGLTIALLDATPSASDDVDASTDRVIISFMVVLINGPPLPSIYLPSALPLTIHWPIHPSLLSPSVSLSLTKNLIESSRCVWIHLLFLVFSFTASLPEQVPCLSGLHCAKSSQVCNLAQHPEYGVCFVSCNINYIDILHRSPWLHIGQELTWTTIKSSLVSTKASTLWSVSGLSLLVCLFDFALTFLMPITEGVDNYMMSIAVDMIIHSTQMPWCQKCNINVNTCIQQHDM